MQISCDLVLGLLNLISKKIVFGNKFLVKMPVKISKTTSIKIGRGGHIKLGKMSSFSPRTVISATDNALIQVGCKTGVNYNTVIVSRESIKIGNNVLIGPNVSIYDHDHNFENGSLIREQGYLTSPIIIEDDVWLGAGVTVLKGVHIGKGSIIGAGTVVTKNIPENSVVYSKNELIIKGRK